MVDHEKTPLEPDFHTRFGECTSEIEIEQKSIPYTLMNADAPKDPTTVCFVPGLLIPYGAYERSLKGLRDAGRSFLAFGYVEANLPIPDAAKVWIEKKFVTEEHVQRALGLIAMVEGVSGVKHPVDVVAHSAGALYATLAATLRPDLFRNLVLYAPAGFIKNDTSLGFIQRASEVKTLITNSLSQAHLGPSGAHARDFWSHVSKDLAVRHALASFDPIAWRYLFQQINSIASTYIAHLIKDLQKKGVRISVVLGEGDDLFPPNLLEPALKDEGIDYRVLAAADHFGIGTTPTTMTSILDELTKMADGAGE